MSTAILELSSILAIAMIPPPSPPDNGPVAIDFGNDSSEFANDGECDDPRFIGGLGNDSLVTDNIGKDASDCRNAVLEKKISYNPLFTQPENYGDDASDYAKDGECDDIRYTGEYGSDAIYVVSDIGHDASDCRAAVEAGEARWQGDTIDIEYGVTLVEMGKTES
ncbi:MAG: hypothetical protein ABJP70_12020 [Erythrobacter sp.]